MEFNSLEAGRVQLIKATGNQLVSTNANRELEEVDVPAPILENIVFTDGETTQENTVPSWDTQKNTLKAVGHSVGSDANMLCQIGPDGKIPSKAIPRITLGECQTFDPTDKTTPETRWAYVVANYYNPPPLAGDWVVISDSATENTVEMFIFSGEGDWKDKANWFEVTVEIGVNSWDGLKGIINITQINSTINKTSVIVQLLDDMTTVKGDVLDIKTNWKVKGAENGTNTVATISPEGVLKIDATTTGAQKFTRTFAQADLVAGKITITHNLNYRVCLVTVVDEAFNSVIPDVNYTDVNNLSLDFTNISPIAGTWTIVCMS